MRVVVLLITVMVMVLGSVQVMVLVVAMVAVVVVIGRLKDSMLRVERRRFAELHLDCGGAREVGARTDLGELAFREGTGHRHHIGGSHGGKLVVRVLLLLLLRITGVLHVLLRVHVIGRSLAVLCSW